MGCPSRHRQPALELQCSSYQRVRAGWDGIGGGGGSVELRRGGWGGEKMRGWAAGWGGTGAGLGGYVLVKGAVRQLLLAVGAGGIACRGGGGLPDCAAGGEGGRS